jgi:hypothetical protein
MQRTEQMANPIAASEIKWAPAPPFGRPGMEVAVLAGNPEKEGPWTLRLKLPENYVFPPHNIPVNETVTVLSGVIYIGLGDTFRSDQGGENDGGQLCRVARQDQSLLMEPN